MKTNEQYFADWESHVFGYGYGTGEEYVIEALKAFMECIDADGKYDYREVGKRIGPVATWLLINVLCHDDKIEYGTSPRFGWLTRGGEELHHFVTRSTLDKLCDAIRQDENYVPCFPDHCNCDDGSDCRKTNQFWRRNDAIGELPDGQ